MLNCPCLYHAGYGDEVMDRSLLTLALDEGEWPISGPTRSAPGKEPRYPL